MSAGLLPYVAFVFALGASLGWAMEALCRQLERPVRWSWLAAAALALALIARATVAAAAAPVTATHERVELPVSARMAVLEWSPVTGLRDALAVALAALGSAADAMVRAVPSGVLALAATTWLASSLFALVVLAFVHLRIRRARRHWAEADLFGIRVRIAPNMGPAVVGVLRPQIVLPHWLLARSHDDQLLVLAHEREHLRARDHLLLGAGCLVVALVPWHPAAWWMLTRLRLAIELDCDARVLRRGVPACTYGALLIDLADRCTGFRAGATALADEGSHLERRLLAMKTDRTKRSLLRAGMLGAAAALTLLAACEAKVPTGPEIQAMDVVSAERAATQVSLLSKGAGAADSAIYFVDGARVSANDAHRIDADRIASVRVRKGNGKRVAEVYIRTTQAKNPERVAFLGPFDTVTVKRRRARRFEGLILIDGSRADQPALSALRPASIASVEIIKGAAAEKLSSDPAAKNGIIQVTTKK